MTYYYTNKKVDYYKVGVPITVLKKKRGISIIEINSKQSYPEVNHCFELSSKKAFQMDERRTGFTTFDEAFLSKKDKFDSIIGKCDYKARSGVEFTPAEVYFIEPKGKVSKKNSYLFNPSKFKNSKYKSLGGLPVQLETKYIRPVIKAPEILPFGFNEGKSFLLSL